MISVGRCSKKRLQRLLESNQDAPHRYNGVGAISEGKALKGFSFNSVSVEIGRGHQDWQSARRSMARWQMFSLPWVHLYPFRPDIELGSVAVVGGGMAGLWFYGAARIIEVVDSRDLYGFTYATTDHMANGEERFQVRIDADGRVFFEIDVFARPQRWYAWLARPLFTWYRTRFRKGAVQLMRC